MATLSDDLKALWIAKEITLQQALELNKQKKPNLRYFINKQKKSEEEQVMNLWDNDGDEEEYDKTAVAE